MYVSDFLFVCICFGYVSGTFCCLVYVVGMFQLLVLAARFCPVFVQYFSDFFPVFLLLGCFRCAWVLFKYVGGYLSWVCFPVFVPSIFTSLEFVTMLGFLSPAS